MRGLKLFISLFTGFELHLAENEWPFNGFRIGISSTVGIDTVILPPVDKSHSFVVVMPHKFKDVSSQSIIRLHEILRDGEAVAQHLHAEVRGPASGGRRARVLPNRRVVGRERRARDCDAAAARYRDGRAGVPEGTGDAASCRRRIRRCTSCLGTKKRQLPPITGAAKADNAPVEGREITTSKYGFEGAREFRLDDIMKELLARAGLEQSVEASIESGSGVGSAATANPAVAELERNDLGDGTADALSEEAVIESAGLGAGAARCLSR